ncbi:MAG: Crp/Fnr family transcriptional regulator [Magnetococcales bacterium]|nr:Crp/Fnr family transcriptional regulator [Magnetococcales bacterium]
MRVEKRAEPLSGPEALVERRREWLEKNPYLAELTPEECQRLNDFVHLMHVKEGQVLFHEGEHDDAIFIIRKGRVAVGHKMHKHEWMDFGAYGYCDLADGDDSEEWQDRREFSEGRCVGEVCTVSRHGRHTLTAQVMEEGDLLVMDGDHLRDLCERFPSFAEHLTLAIKRMENDSWAGGRATLR